MITVDTHVAVKKLIASGFTESEAENMINSFVIQEQFKQLEESVVKPSEFKEAINKLDNKMSELTKDLRHDIANLKNELKSDIAKLDSKINETKSELKLDISKSKNDLLQWMIVLVLGIMGMIIGLYFK